MQEKRDYGKELFYFSLNLAYSIKGFPCGSAANESAYNAGDLSLIPWLGRSPGERERLPTPVFWPGEFHGLYSPWGCKESDRTEQLSLAHFHTHFLVHMM